VKPVPTFRSVTVAPAIIADRSSATVPPIEAVDDCAEAKEMNKSPIAMEERILRKTDIKISSYIVVKPGAGPGAAIRRQMVCRQRKNGGFA
jgi:hypothetical protein